MKESLCPLPHAALAVWHDGEAPGAFALETAMDELAVNVGIDPLDLRLHNYASTSPATEPPWSSKHLDDCYRIGAERFRSSNRTRYLHYSGPI
jgi:CO/xanthine dehydrogenase Mo-binding subunit